MTIHALAALSLVLLFAWHTLARKYVLFSPTLRDRRLFLRLLAVSVAGVAVSQFVEVVDSALALPGAFRRFTGSYETGSHTGVFPVVTWLLDNPAPVNVAAWRLSISGLVEKEMRLSYSDISDVSGDTVTEIIDCTGGWFSEQVWIGVSLKKLFALAGVSVGARTLVVRSITGYERRFDLNEAHQFLLATGVAGGPLDHLHGYPVRLVATGHRGFEWVKWVVSLELTDTSHWLQPPVPLQ